MNSDEIKSAYKREYKQIIQNYFPEACDIIEKIAENYDFSKEKAQHYSSTPGRLEFISKIISMTSPFIGPIEAGKLEKELLQTKI